ncbi:hypothetical protein CEXT_341541 [Caerostris extrusa]|uniref:Uncharacterized protein n=1 Tax=Caerostris extrusa TaxID=172846 RepID=A0AAV4NFN9_CAEEX|nr:hypothetical protein CEXT_341541 [Caerostris extrusa]
MTTFSNSSGKNLREPLSAAVKSQTPNQAQASSSRLFLSTKTISNTIKNLPPLALTLSPVYSVGDGNAELVQRGNALAELQESEGALTPSLKGVRPNCGGQT